MLPALELIKLDIRAEFSKPIPTILPIKIIRAMKELENRYAKAEIEPAVTYMKDLFFIAKEAFTKDNMAIIFSKDVRYLPFILDLNIKNEDKIIANRNFTAFILNIISKRNRTNSVLARLAKIYILLYGHDYQGLELLRQFVLTNLQKTSSKRKSVLKYKENIFLFGRDAVMLTVSRVHSVSDVKEFLGSVGFSDDMLSSGFVDAFSASYFRAPAISMDKKINNLRPLLETPEGRTNDALMGGMYASANVLIPFANISDTKTRTDVRQFYLRHLKDPRFPGAIKWAHVSPDAKAIFKRWVSKFDLDTFFELIEKSACDSAWAYRKKFWETYLPYMDSTWVVLGSKARILLRSMKDAEKEEWNRFDSYGELKGAGSEQSVFIFEIRGYVFVDWSHAGGLRIWEKSVSPISIGEKVYTANALRSDCDHYKRHCSSDRYSWQEDVKYWLSSKCGITPKESFRL